MSKTAGQTRSQTLIVVPLGRWAVHAVVALLVGLVAAVWVFAFPHDLTEAVIDGTGSLLVVIFCLVLLNSKRIESHTASRDGLIPVIPGLWQGGLGDEVFSFKRYDLDVVVDLRDDRERPNINVLVPVGKRYIRWPLIDRELPDLAELEALARFLAEKTSTQRVGVFCNLGINRSGLVCAAVTRVVAEKSIEGLMAVENKVFNERFSEHMAAEKHRIDLKAVAGEQERLSSEDSAEASEESATQREIS